jgi:NAD(P)-dependent dehydrogenase (short-subunit alcohol dehydrogenase family)
VALATIDLRDEVAVVTGGGRGIGRAIALRLANAGAKVAVIARSENEIAETSRRIHQTGGQARPFAGDVTDADAMSSAFSAIERTFGSVSILVNNAGIIGPIAPFWETSIQEWWRVIDVNLHGPALCSHLALGGMVTRQRGRIINLIAGGAAFALTYFSGYIASKAALARFSEVLAAETKPHGISVFALAPATVRTAMSEHSLNCPNGKKWIPWFARIFDEGLTVPAERVAEFAAHLASGVADALSGRFLSVTDDLEFLLKNLAEIEQENLYSLRLRKLPSAVPSTKFDAIRKVGEQARSFMDLTN